MFLLIDNYDSFTFNLVQAFQLLGRDPVVLKNDDPRVLELATSGELTMVCLSPGPSRPENAGLCLKFLELLPHAVPVLGVCLGHQTLGHFAGAEVVQAELIMHGKTSMISHDGQGLFADMPNPVSIGRYHSLLVDVDNAPEDVRRLLTVTARTAAGEVMAMKYNDRPWVGVQFHPESVLTPEGLKLLARFPEGL
ncbi:MAG: aminodeoxychorismate/anthranilate synthase component II [Proteobacteria bacterium]|nr:aminodeoxychorismate/anthranilate synthase component II [Pseudomonadota bacterium]